MDREKQGYSTASVYIVSNVSQSNAAGYVVVFIIMFYTLHGKTSIIIKKP